MCLESIRRTALVGFGVLAGAGVGASCDRHKVPVLINRARTTPGRGNQEYCKEVVRTFNRNWLIPALRLMLLAAFAILMPRPGAAQAIAYETLYSFQGSPDGADPSGAVVIGKDGALYGTTYAGGTSGLGTVFVLTPVKGEPWTETVLHNFSGPDGSSPTAGMVFGSKGVLYGTTSNGPTGAGTIFELTPPSTAVGTWTETVLYSFSPAGNGVSNEIPLGGVLIGPGGTLYTTASGGNLSYSGTAVAVTPPTTPGGSWTGSVIFVFNIQQQGAGGTQPEAGLVLEGGSLFGTTSRGGGNAGFFCGLGCGEAYELTPPTTSGGTWLLTTIHDFEGSPGDGGISHAALTLGPGGVLYGTTTSGGSGTACEGGCGTVVQLTTPVTAGGAWTETVLYNFTGGANGDGAYPGASVAVGKNGALYGTTPNGGRFFKGTVFELTPPATSGGAWTEKVLHSFSGENGDGATPVTALALSSTGVLYGTASGGGAAGQGTIFAVKP